jgi:predicted aspartyl protease
MGTFRVACEITNPLRRSKAAKVPGLLVDTGSECTWVPESILKGLGIKPEKKDVSFLMANGNTVTRNVGFAIVRMDKHFTIDEVVFALEGDLCLLGARSLQGMNLRVDPRGKRLVAAGPVPAA